MSIAGKFVSLNPAAASMWGYSKNELEDMLVLDLVHKEDKDLAREILFENPPEAAEISLECRMLKKNARVINCLWSVSLKQGMLLCTICDISFKKEFEILRKEFLNIVSHELRTPLNAVSAAAQLGQIGALGEMSLPAKHGLDRIASNCRSLIDLINDILDLESLESGKFELNLAATDLDSLLSDLSQNINQFGDENIDCALELRELPIQADATRLFQAIYSLARFMQLNAVDPSSVQIRVRQEQDHIIMDLTDSGPVLAQVVREHMFERYKDFSLDKSLLPGSFHADLRLPLAAQLIKCHDGSIRFEAHGTDSNICIVSFPLKGPR